ncbi:hypothetical protein AN639_12575 [Candidatus Epulonipiscium fishelsonii]|uniref:Uncharacterized protein n=1 Tax=Candidatus Epulonipiscium fishelsonii TaxID=77094 RepID=A0ACC8XGG6_9FIRM|nr:hypothetical protein AN639_12575 [Epulopiscium sp. SCG-B05WGA-EpuloA1]ONI42684.1 hypothetical protein AN396_13395 [Epulopiscium sp. SCG-B11WGA-EpuloA1]
MIDKATRAIMIGLSVYLYYVFIVNDFSILRALTKILMVSLLLVIMERIKKKSSKKFSEYSSIEMIDKMSENTFIAYIGEMYKRLGYQVNVPTDSVEKGISDLTLYKGGKKFRLKCLHVEDTVSSETMNGLIKNQEKYIKAPFIIVTNGKFLQESVNKALETPMILRSRGYIEDYIEQVPKDPKKNRYNLNFN